MKTERATDKGQQFNRYPFYSVRIWHGMRLGDFFWLLWKNRFRVHPVHWKRVFTVTLAAGMNSTFGGLQSLLYGRKLNRTVIHPPPLFIIGHWRSGTTYLHELLVRDKRFAFPTTYQCFVPHHFLVTEWFLPKLLRFFLPAKRPMDNMPMGFDHPQEDEFALCSLGAPTPYFRMAFPNHGPVYQQFLDMQSVDERELKRFKWALQTFVQALTYRHGRQLVLKSPPHTGRIKLLAELFPGARFIHIVRDPHLLFASTRRLWQAMDNVQSFQKPRHDDLDDYILNCLERMYDGFERQRERIDPATICDLRYEDLVRDPVGQLEEVYKALKLGDFEDVRQDLEDYVVQQRDYEPGRHELTPVLAAEVDRRWSGYRDKYGYASPALAEE
jgi:hypothetical protein